MAREGNNVAKVIREMTVAGEPGRGERKEYGGRDDKEGSRKTENNGRTVR